MEQRNPTLIHRRGVVLLAIFTAPLAYACVVPVSDELCRANPLAALAVVLLLGMAFVVPFVYVFGPLGSFRFIAWFWKRIISPRTEVHLFLKVYVFSIFLILLLIDLGIFCWMSPRFLEFMDKHATWIGDAFKKCFGP